MQQQQLLPRQWLSRLFEQNIARALGFQRIAFCGNDTDYSPRKTLRACGDTNTEDQRSRHICFKACVKGLLTFAVREDTLLSSLCLHFFKTTPAILTSKVAEEEAEILRILSAFENLAQIHFNFGECQACLERLKCHANRLKKKKKEEIHGYLHPKSSLLTT